MERQLQDSQELRCSGTNPEPDRLAPLPPLRLHLLLLYAMIKRLSNTNKVLMHHVSFTLTHLGHPSLVGQIPRFLL